MTAVEVGGVRVVARESVQNMQKVVKLILFDGTSVIGCTYGGDGGCDFTGRSWQTVAAHYRKIHEAWVYPARAAQAKREDKIIETRNRVLVPRESWQDVPLGQVVVEMAALKSQIGNLERLLESRTTERDGLREQVAELRKQLKEYDGIARFIASRATS